MTPAPPTKCTRLKQVYKRSEKNKKTLLYTCTYMFYTYQFTARCFVLLEEMGKLFFLHYFSTCGGAACGAMLEFYSQYFHSILMFLLFLKSQLSPHQVIDSISDFNLEPQKCSASSARQCGHSQL